MGRINRYRIATGFFAICLILASDDSESPASRDPAGSAPATIEAYTLGSLQSCLKKNKKQLDDFEISCSLDSFVAKARKLNFSKPGERYLVARLLVKALYNRHQSELLKNMNTAANSNQAAELFPNVPRGRSQFLQYFFPESGEGGIPMLPPSAEAKFVSQSKALLDEIAFWLAPLYSEAPSPNDFLKNETPHLLFWAYGLSLQFDALSKLIEENTDALFDSPDFEQLYLLQISSWIKRFGAHPLRSWYAAKLASKRPAENSTLSDQSWDYWMESLRLLDRPLAEDQKESTLRQLKWLWVVGPEAKRNAELKKIASDLGLETEFASWDIANLNWTEYSLRVQAQIRGLNTQNADSLMEKIHKDKTLSTKLLTSRDEIWQALQLHIKILKILDERSRIANLIESYEANYKFFDTPTEKKELFNHFDRLYQLAVQFWTLEENDHSIRLLDLIDSSKSKDIKPIQLKVAYVRARMMEQKDTSHKAIEYMKKVYKMDLREDQKLELGWRTFFRLFEGNPKNVTESLAFIIDFEKYAKKAGETPLKIKFWRAHVLAKLKKEKDAIKLWQSCFEEDPYNYYGVISALLIQNYGGKLPDDWYINEKYERGSFDEKVYINAEGYPVDEKSKGIARAIVLAKVRDLDRSAAVARQAAKLKPWRSLSSVDETLSSMRDMSRLFVILGDKRSAMNLMGGLLASKSNDLTSEDWEFIYPRVFEGDIKKRAEERKLDPWVVSSVIRQESAFDPRARSHVDALGLMQLLPSTALKEAKILGKKDFKPEDLYEPRVAIDLGSNHLSRLLKIFGSSYICAFAAYNAGLPPLKNWIGTHSGQSLTFIEKIPYKETRDYVKKLLRNYIMYRRLYEKSLMPLPSLLAMPQAKVSGSVSAYDDENRVAQE